MTKDYKIKDIIDFFLLKNYVYVIKFLNVVFKKSQLQNWFWKELFFKNVQ